MSALDYYLLYLAIFLFYLATTGNWETGFMYKMWLIHV